MFTAATKSHLLTAMRVMDADELELDEAGKQVARDGTISSATR